MLGTTAVQAQHPQTRQGFWIGFGFGFGSLGLSCNGCSSISRESGISGFLKMGGTVNEHLLLGGESDGWTKDVGGTRITTGNLSFTAYYYPAPASGFFLRGGLGFASYQESGQSASGGFGITFGLGYDVRVGTNFSLTPVANYSWGSVGDAHSGGLIIPGTKENVFQVGLGFTWH
jgi:hypothetical protein